MGVRLHSKQIILHIDNISLVHILNNQSSKSPRVTSNHANDVMKQYSIQHFKGRTNIIADAISRKQWDVFRREAPYADIKHSLFHPDSRQCYPRLNKHIDSLICSNKCKPNLPSWFTSIFFILEMFKVYNIPGSHQIHILTNS